MVVRKSVTFDEKVFNQIELYRRKCKEIPSFSGAVNDIISSHLSTVESGIT